MKKIIKELKAIYSGINIPHNEYCVEEGVYSPYWSTADKLAWKLIHDHFMGGWEHFSGDREYPIKTHKSWYNNPSNKWEVYIDTPDGYIVNVPAVFRYVFIGYVLKGLGEELPESIQMPTLEHLGVVSPYTNKVASMELSL